MLCATNYAHSLFNNNINLCAICSWDICLQLHFTCNCTAVARAHTQLPHDNRHRTCKGLSLIRFEIRIRMISAYSIRDLIWTEISNSQVPMVGSRDMVNCPRVRTDPGKVWKIKQFCPRKSWKTTVKFLYEPCCPHPQPVNFFCPHPVHVDLAASHLVLIISSPSHRSPVRAPGL